MRLGYSGEEAPIHKTTAYLDLFQLEGRLPVADLLGQCQTRKYTLQERSTDRCRPANTEKQQHINWLRRKRILFCHILRTRATTMNDENGENHQEQLQSDEHVQDREEGDGFVTKISSNSSQASASGSDPVHQRPVAAWTVQTRVGAPV